MHYFQQKIFTSMIIHNHSFKKIKLPIFKRMMHFDHNV